MGKTVFPFVTKSSDKEIDYEEVKRIANTLDLHPKLIELLFLKNLTDEKSIRAFLYPSTDNFHDPFLMKNMHEITARITEAVEHGEKVVVFGDYDCDGICASAILCLFLSSLGADVFCYIPNRECDGYGLNIETLERIIENESPDLIVTCDCGISCQNEIAYVLDIGVDIIVTDHHEAGDNIPECLVLNPKQPDCDYPFNQLCGAGVVLKLVEAIGGREKAAEFMGLAAIATIADLVPLMDENRLIVKLGLNYEHLISNLGLKMLIEKLSIADTVLSSDIAFKIAPRINAAGRMGDAYRAFQLLTSDDKEQITSIIEEIEHDNGQRKELCNKLFDEAMEIISGENIVDNRAIVLSHPQWEKGITGIVAAKLTNEFYRPTFILVRSGDCYKGTARSIPDINIYELLTSVKDLLPEFGGHSQAAGFAIAGENIEEFKRRVNEYLNKFDSSSFIAKIKYDLDIEIDDVSMKLLQDMELLEPYGNSNNRPLFRIKVKDLKVSSLNNADHLCINLTDDINVYAFNYGKQASIFLGDDEKELVLDFKLNSYKNKTKIDAYVRGCLPSSHNIDDTLSKANFIKYINFKAAENPRFETYEYDRLDELIGENIFGTLLITGSKASYEKLFKSAKIDYIIVHEMMYSSVKNNYNRVIASPEFDENLLLANYEKVIFLDTPISDGVISYINKKTKATVYVPKTSNLHSILDGIDMSRETFLKYYNIIKENENRTSDDLGAYLKRVTQRNGSFNISQFIVCLSVFVELGIVKISKKNFSIKLQKNVKVSLEDSKNYIYLREKITKSEA